MNDYETAIERQNMSAITVESKAIGFPNSNTIGYPHSKKIGSPKSHLDGQIRKIFGQEHQYPTKPIIRNHRRSVTYNLAKTEPTSAKEALTNPAWTATMTEELDALNLN